MTEIAEVLNRAADIIDPLTELHMMRPDMPVVAVVLPDGVS